jgi:hypothetical protein
MNKVSQVWRGPTFAAGPPCQLDNCARCYSSVLYSVFHLIAVHHIVKASITTTGSGSHACLIQYVAVQTALEDDEVVLYLVKELHSKIDLSTSSSSPLSKSNVIDPDKDKLRVLGEEETLAGLMTDNLIHGYLVIISSRIALIYYTCKNIQNTRF